VQGTENEELDQNNISVNNFDLNKEKSIYNSNNKDLKESILSEIPELNQI
jgi:hypothetical protein